MPYTKYVRGSMRMQNITAISHQEWQKLAIIILILTLKTNSKRLSVFILPYHKKNYCACDRTVFSVSVLSAIGRQYQEQCNTKLQLTSASMAWILDFLDLLSSKVRNLGGVSVVVSPLCLVRTILSLTAFLVEDGLPNVSIRPLHS